MLNETVLIGATMITALWMCVKCSTHNVRGRHYHKKKPRIYQGDKAPYVNNINVMCGKEYTKNQESSRAITLASESDETFRVGLPVGDETRLVVATDMEEQDASGKDDVGIGQTINSRRRRQEDSAEVIVKFIQSRKAVCHVECLDVEAPKMLMGLLRLTTLCLKVKRLQLTGVVRIVMLMCRLLTIPNVTSA